jgi:SAM-dependent methyltransferase
MQENPDDLPPTQRFTSRVENYIRHRPRYPQALVDVLVAEVGFQPDWPLADVGSGTGILSEVFLQNGNTVFGVEPNREMRLAAEKLLAGWPCFISIDAAAEATALPDQSVNGVVVGQAFHWFDAPRAVAEFRRIAGPGSFVALIWNARDTAATLFMTEYERILHEFGTDFARSGKEFVPVEELRDLFGPTLRLRTLKNFQDHDWEGLRGRLLSASYIPLAGAPGFDEMMATLRRAFDQNQRHDQVRMEYETRIYIAQL